MSGETKCGLSTKWKSIQQSKGMNSDICYNMGEPFAKPNEPGTEDYILHDSIYPRSKNHLYALTEALLVVTCELYSSEKLFKNLHRTKTAMCKSSENLGFLNITLKDHTIRNRTAMRETNVIKSRMLQRTTKECFKRRGTVSVGIR